MKLEKFPVRSGINTKIAAQTFSETFVSSILKILSITLKKAFKSPTNKELYESRNPFT
jgi:hypothetical protein